MSLNEYWGPERQQKYKLEFLSGQHRANEVSDMADYFVSQISFARTFRPPMNDDSIINVIITHFPSEVGWCIGSNHQGNTINDVNELLRRKDYIENRNGTKNGRNQDFRHTY